jgi:hypothetical protein
MLSLADVQPQLPQPDYGYGPRWDEASQSYAGAPKGLGFLGPLQRGDGRVMSEFSRDAEIDGKNVSYPLIVPTLTKDEIHYLLTAGDDAAIPTSIERKAKAHATERLKAGLSPFASSGEQVSLYPELPRAAIPGPR